MVYSSFCSTGLTMRPLIECGTNLCTNIHVMDRDDTIRGEMKPGLSKPVVSKIDHSDRKWTNAITKVAQASQNTLNQ
jgi:hypothetical protein